MIISTNMINVLSSLPNDKLIEIRTEVSKAGLNSGDKQAVLQMLDGLIEANLLK
jgi:hypothetical protein